MLEELDRLERWPDVVKDQQRGWIGRSKGASIKFKLAGDANEGKMIEVFTTRPETIFGATYIAVSQDNDELLTDLCKYNMAARNQLHSYKQKIEEEINQDDF